MDWIAAVALATFTAGLFAWIRADVAALRKEMRSEFSEVRGDISALSKEVAALRERMAHTDGLLEGLREVVAGRHAV